ncbi:hypothetical protein K503DRAFT_470694 [Rhizopogon vinicolor AM-OR11-026]|uniref:DUF6533 domain-containing protein n=1 Tax=Rhizopogon vinicolor AM-OR11-026 TaxID=1314800 RepID=A0A1B7MNG8_9AGAM|nr:hypothetical protein K503DRAFT_470694 [Rhizopogon vinicolor AM-OR11-026]
MTLFSNDPSWWPTININAIYSYVTVASLTMVIYDWVLTFGQEFELVWRKRWSLVTVLYLSVRYVGILYTVFNLIVTLPSVSLTDVVSNYLYRCCHSCSTDCAPTYRGSVVYLVMNWTPVVVNVMLGVIMIAWLHAMYQQSRKMLLFLIATFLAIQIACGVLVTIASRNISGEEYILSGTHQCYYSSKGDAPFLAEMTWVFGTAWAVLALCLAVWIPIKHFHQLQRTSTGWALCFSTQLFFTKDIELIFRGIWDL